MLKSGRENVRGEKNEDTTLHQILHAHGVTGKSNVTTVS
jgi:hypothetical protein